MLIPSQRIIIPFTIINASCCLVGLLANIKCTATSFCSCYVNYYQKKSAYIMLVTFYAAIIRYNKYDNTMFFPVI